MHLECIWNAEIHKLGDKNIKSKRYFLCFLHAAQKLKMITWQGVEIVIKTKSFRAYTSANSQKSVTGMIIINTHATKRATSYQTRGISKDCMAESLRWSDHLPVDWARWWMCSTQRTSPQADWRKALWPILSEPDLLTWRERNFK